MRSVTLVIAALFFLAPSQVAGQERLLLQPGQRVRVTAPDLGIFKKVPVFEALRGDTLVVRTPSVVAYYPLALVTQFDVSQGRYSNSTAYASTGAVIGLLVGLVATRGRSTGSETDWVTIALYVGPVIGGTILGAVIGTQSKTDRWEEVPLDRIRMSFAPQRDGRFGLGLSVRF